MKEPVVDPRPNEVTEAVETPLIEPLIIPALSVTGFDVRTDDHTMHFVGWVATLTGNGDPLERRIVVRFDMSLDNVRQLWSGVEKAIPKGH